MPLRTRLRECGRGWSPPALHALDPDFKAFSLNDRTRALAQSLGLKDPLVLQSMIIFKVRRRWGWASARAVRGDLTTGLGVPRPACVHAAATPHWRRRQSSA